MTGSFIKSNLIFLAIIIISVNSFGQLKLPRTKVNFNRDWIFQLGDHTGAELTNFNDNEWQHIGLPHSFSIPYFLSPDFYVGFGWYRKHFNVPANHIHSKRLFLEFEAAFQVAEVFINGKKAGEHRGGYTGFSIDISDAVKAGDNLIAVRVNNIWDPGLAPRAGEHVFSAGIYRDVYLVVTEPVHVDWCGTFVSTPFVTEKKATVRMQTEIKNDDAKARSVKLKTDIIDPAGRLVASAASVQQVAAGASCVFDQTTPRLANPKLWHPDHPFLYTAVTTVLDGAKKIDEYKTSFGIRSIRWTADSGFFLNGKHLYLRGANAHQDHAGWGDAVTNAGFYRDVKMIKDAGFNFIRGSHYPHDPAFVEACDRLGVLFWCENTFWGIGGSDKTPEGYWNCSAYPTRQKDMASFEASVKQELREMIRIHRNSPSVIVWSMSNEPFFTASQTVAPMRNLLKELVGLTHSEDPTRPAAIGGAQRPLDSNRIDRIGDVAGYNGDGGTQPVFQNPRIPNLVSEYGSTTSERPGNYVPGWGDIAADSGKAVHAWRSGQAIWCAFDHGSIAGSNLGKMGIIDYFRIPKRAWYWYRNEYLHIPPPAWPQPGKPARLKLEVDGSGMGANAPEDVKLLVIVLDAAGKVISNNPPVELRVVSGPGEFPTGPSIKFEEGSDIRILDGQAAIEFRSWYAGRTVIRATSPGLQPAEAVIDFKGDVPYKKGSTPAIITHPYARYKNGRQNVLQVLGRDNPAFASSSDPEHLAGYAADGNTQTWWRPNAGDINPFWMLDTEKKLSMAEINIAFPEEAVYQYKVEVSDNGHDWKTVGDYMSNQQKELTKQIKLPGLVGGVIRISFDNAAHARLAEVSVTGIVLD
jgi:beta-galactosidase